MLSFVDEEVYVQVVRVIFGVWLVLMSFLIHLLYFKLVDAKLSDVGIQLLRFLCGNGSVPLELSEEIFKVSRPIDPYKVLHLFVKFSYDFLRVRSAHHIFIPAEIGLYFEVRDGRLSIEIHALDC